MRFCHCLCLSISVALLAVAQTGCSHHSDPGAGAPNPTQKESTPQPPAARLPPLDRPKVTAEDLAKGFAEDPDGTYAKYEGKIIIVEGVVAGNAEDANIGTQL